MYGCIFVNTGFLKIEGRVKRDDEEDGMGLVLLKFFFKKTSIGLLRIEIEECE